MNPEVYLLIQAAISNAVNENVESVALLQTAYRTEDVQHWELKGTLTDGTVVKFRVHNVEVDLDSLVYVPKGE